MKHQFLSLLTPCGTMAPAPFWKRQFLLATLLFCSYYAADFYAHAYVGISIPGPAQILPYFLASLILISMPSHAEGKARPAGAS